ncbi:hypothetical protein D3C87_1574810 [compost metagenome]
MRAKSRTRQLDHRADQIVDVDAGFADHRLCHRIDALLDVVEFGAQADERHHDFRHDGSTGFACGFDRCLENGSGLHFGDLRIGDGEAATTMAEHRIELVQLVDALAQG